jgi:hypothetical protein
MPVFYFALYRDKGTMQFPTRRRKLALVAAMTYGIVMAPRLQALSNSLSWFGVLGLLGNLTYILLLVVMSRKAREEPSASMPVSNLLSVVTQVTVLVWGLMVAYQFVCLAVVPFTYASLKNYLYQVGRTPPPFRNMVTYMVLAFISPASLLAAPYIVWRSNFGRSGHTSETETLKHEQPG